jgi:hypothetical protein
MGIGFCPKLRLKTNDINRATEARREEGSPAVALAKEGAYWDKSLTEAQQRPRPFSQAVGPNTLFRQALSDHDNQLVYHTAWSNPRPETEIAAIHFTSALVKPALLLIAISLEP